MRHAETMWNQPPIRVQGSCPDPSISLSSGGLLSVPTTLANVKKPTVLVTSSLRRSQQTAEAWFGLPFLKIPVLKRIEPDIKEINAGIYEGKYIEALKDDPMWQRWMQSPHTFEGFPEGECLQEVADRSLKCFASLCAEYGDSNHRVCVITHGVVMRILKCYLRGQEFEHLWSHPVANLERITLTDSQVQDFQLMHEKSCQINFF